MTVNVQGFLFTKREQRNVPVINNYYGENAGMKTFLKIYTADDTGKEEIHRQLEDQEAYDTWHLAYYMKHLMEYRKLTESPGFAFEEMPYPVKNVLVYLLAMSYHKCKGVDSIMELGSSVFELIDALNMVDAYYDGDLCPDTIRYLGIELSEMLARASLVLHPDHNISLYRDAEQGFERFNVLVDRGVAGYAFNDSKSAADFINLADCAYLNIFVSQGETFSSRRLGKELTYFSLRELIDGLDKPLWYLFGHRSPGPDLTLGNRAVEGFFLCCDEEILESFMNLGESDDMTNKWFADELIYPQEAFMLLDNTGDE